MEQTASKNLIVIINQTISMPWDILNLAIKRQSVIEDILVSRA